MARWGLLSAGLLLGLGGCTASPMPEPTPSAGSARPTVAATGLRGCETSVEGPTAVDPRAGVGVGPVWLPALEYRLANSPADPQGWRRFKIPLTIEGHERVTVTIPAEFHDIAKLTYVPGRGDYATTFVPCGTRPQTHFAGGVAIREPMCLPLAVTWSGRTEQLSLEFGEGACAPR